MLTKIVAALALAILATGCDSLPMTNTTTVSNNVIATLPEPVNLRSVRSEISTSLTFVNELNLAVSVNWVDFNGKEVVYATLLPGEAYTQQTFDTHPWVVRENTNHAPVKIVVAEPEPLVVKIRPTSISNSTY